MTSQRRIWCSALVALCAFGLVSGLTINIGYVSPLTGTVGFQQVASAVTMGIAQAHADGYLNGTDVM